MTVETNPFDVISKQKLRYGENPHQEGFFWRTRSADPLALSLFEQLQGVELSFNNYLDADGALYAIAQVGQEQPACVVIKHTNPCGAAVGETIEEAYEKAWEGDSLAAFGGIIAVNRPVGRALAEAMVAGGKLFDVLLAPEVDSEALEVFGRRQARRVLANPALTNPIQPTDIDVKRVRGGFLVQLADTRTLRREDLQVISQRQPTSQQVDDLLLAWQVCRASKSNTIVLVRGGMLVGSGVGQQDRRRCCELAVGKSGGRARGSVAASDAFFPFPDGPEVLIDSGVTAILHPGGSIRDAETTELCNQRDTVLVLTGGIRAFRH